MFKRLKQWWSTHFPTYRILCKPLESGREKAYFPQWNRGDGWQDFFPTNEVFRTTPVRFQTREEAEAYLSMPQRGK